MSDAQRDTPDSGIMNYALRMVIPMRREFGRALDVQHFLHDLAYAKEVLDEARASQNPKLREYAAYLDKKILGPRNSAAPSPSVAKPTIESAPSTSEKAPEFEDSQLSAAEEAKQLMLAKYRSGLR